MMIIQPSRFGGGSGGNSVTVSSDWGGTLSATSPVTSPARTLTVPGGNPGSLQLGISGTVTVQYRINVGAFTTFSDLATISVATGNSLTFRGINMLSGDSVTITVVDTSTGATVGSAALNRS